MQRPNRTISNICLKELASTLIYLSGNTVPVSYSPVTNFLTQLRHIKQCVSVSIFLKSLLFRYILSFPIFLHSFNYFSLIFFFLLIHIFHVLIFIIECFIGTQRTFLLSIIFFLCYIFHIFLILSFCLFSFSLQC